jgi:hypothetical protein
LDHCEAGNRTHSNDTGNTGQTEPKGGKVEILWPLWSCTHEGMPEKDAMLIMAAQCATRFSEQRVG